MDISDQLVQNLPYIRNFVKRFYMDKDNQDDLVSEVCLKALENSDKFKEDSNFKGWLSRIATNEFINDFRRQKRMEPIYIDSNEVWMTLESTTNEIDDSRDFLNGILELLDYPERAALILYSRGYKYDEIANIVNIPIGTLKSRIFNARSKVRSAIV